MGSRKCILEMEGEMKRLMKVWVSILCSLCYCYFISSRVPKGLLRFVSLSPVLYLFTILPLQLTTVLPTGVTAFFVTWLTNSKLLLFTFDLGPLTLTPNSHSLLRFLSFACLPIKLTPFNSNSKSKFHFILFPIKALLSALLLIGLKDQYKQKLHPIITLSIYCILMYLFMDVVMGLCNIVVHAAFRIQLQLPSDDPYFSTSLRDFWGRRWNLIVTYTLRHTVYNPFRSLLLSNTVLGPHWASMSGVMATFFVSGLMHELIFYYVTRVTPTWEVTCFFLLHGVCVVAEFGAVKLLGRKWRLHWAVSGPITVEFVIVTAAWLFFPPLMRDGTDERTIKEFNNVVECVMGNFY